MAECPLCGIDLDLEEDELDEGDVLSCDECGATLTVVGLKPLEIEEVEEEDSGDEDEDLDESEDGSDLWRKFRGRH
jgi:alpha-aminoadipate carrier protein LysW